MTITKLLERNADLYGDEIALMEINLTLQDEHHVIWREYELIENNPAGEYRLEMSWRVFDEKANRLAHLLLRRGIGKGNKVGILLMNCIEWLPIYFGVLKSGATVVPLNFRYTADEIEYCLDLAEVDVLSVRNLLTYRNIFERMPKTRRLFYVGENRPSFAESYDRLAANCLSCRPDIELRPDDDAAIYFSSGTTGFPKAILHKHASIMATCETEWHHHQQTRDDVFLLIPPLYHTGAKMHWFGSLYSGSKAIILRGIRPDWILRTVSEEKASIVWLLVPWAQDT